MIALMEMQVLSFVAENERCSIRQRQREGIEAARRKGVRFGRTKKELSDNFDTAFAGWLSGELSCRKAAKLCGMPVSFFCRRGKEKRGNDEMEEMN